tara:strand:- start:941 stop:1393 length:453 start_codon:yes stop_codon:yes gene_type:complete
MMAQHKALCLRFTGSETTFDLITTVQTGKKLSLRAIPKSYKRTVGYGSLEHCHDYSINNKTLSLYAWSDGESGTENKHELPPPLADKLYFGNAYIIAHIDNEIVDIQMDDYKDLQEKYFEGFDDIGSEDTWSDEESMASDDSLNDFIVPG